jgi:transposase-like protein
MGDVKKKFSKEFKATVAIEAIKGLKTSAEISSEYSVHPTQIAKWKKELRTGLPEIFSGKQNSEANSKEQLVDNLYKRIGQLEMENDWLKKSYHFKPGCKKKYDYGKR